MKTVMLLILVFGGIVNGLQAQDSTAASGKRVYLFVGGSVPLTSSQAHISNMYITARTTKKLDLGIGLYGSSFADSGVSEFDLTKNQEPRHEVAEFNVSVGKIINFHKTGFLSLFAGPSFVQYIMPHNFRSTYTGGWKGYDKFEYDTRTYYLPGISARADVVILPFRNMLLSKKATRKVDFGASVGGVVNYNRKLTSWGLNLNLVLGMF